MGALATRAGVAFHRDFYLCPLSAVHVPPEVLAGYVAAVARGEHVLSPIKRPRAGGETEHIADGFELVETLSAEHDTWTVTWSERRLVVRSLQQARTAERALRTRLAKA